MEKLGPGDPQRIGGYRLLGRLGAGGMGQVYLARSDRGRMVAVKLVRPELAARDEFRARFRQEVRSAQRVGGYWTAPVLDADTEAPVPWVATGYVAGPSLQQVVGRDHGPLPERSVRILAAGLAHALTNIHAAGIVHRDLKPSNVMVTIEGPRVIDFGVARALETLAGSPAAADLTRTGALIGSPGFMAPEQVRGERITPACDIFCLGSVLAYAATGTLPFGTADSGAHALMFRVAEEEPDLTGLPEGIADLVRACLRKDPAARPSLAWILEHTGAEDTVSEGRSREPWLPGTLVAQLGRHAVRLLDAEDPQAATEHAGRDGAGAAPAPGPWPAAGRTAPTAGHPAYGAPAQQHPQPAYGYPAAGHWPGAVGAPTGGGHGGPGGPATAVGPGVPGGPVPGNPYAQSPTYTTAPPPVPYPQPTPYGYDGTPDHPEPEPPRRGRRGTALLVGIALVVALAAGGSVYAYLNDGDDTRADADPTPTAAPTTPAQSPTRPSPTASPSPSPSPSASADGAVPQAYLGTWTTTIDSASGSDSRRLTLTQGEVGDTVLKLIADGAGYHCEFAAPLSRRPAADGPLRIGPSTVTTGEPATSCTPGDPTEITLLADGRLERVNTATGEKLTYSR
ncbi:serine/threonine protein kinase [Streptomyces sp. bgisy154]|uniref:serine/threonine-protein kinase n=1 Tax=Streptomyces sp. bgisy154 TaxID=3413794 RepID=UPI003D726B2F